MRLCDFRRAGMTVWCGWCGIRFECQEDIDHRQIQHPCEKAPDYLSCIHLGKAAGIVKVSCGKCGSRHQAFACDVHLRCLPTFRGPWDADHESERELYRLCNECDNFQGH